MRIRRAAARDGERTSPTRDDEILDNITLYLAPRSWAERAYPNLVHYNRLDRGGHFPAWEQPELFAQELRAGFRSVQRGEEN